MSETAVMLVMVGSSILYIVAVLVVGVLHFEEPLLPIPPRWPLMWTLVAILLSPMCLAPVFLVKGVIRLYQPTVRDDEAQR